MTYNTKATLVLVAGLATTIVLLISGSIISLLWVEQTGTPAFWVMHFVFCFLWGWVMPPMLFKIFQKWNDRIFLREREKRDKKWEAALEVRRLAFFAYVDSILETTLEDHHGEFNDEQVARMKQVVEDHKVAYVKGLEEFRSNAET